MTKKFNEYFEEKEEIINENTVDFGGADDVFTKSEFLNKLGEMIQRLSDEAVDKTMSAAAWMEELEEHGNINHDG